MNFASAALGTSIHCSTVSVDGFEVGNLISDATRLRNVGFLAEGFVNPPVHITLSFSCPVNIRKIIVNGHVGSQRSVGFQLYTAVFNVKAHSEVVTKFDDQIFRPIGRCYTTNHSHPLVCFTNAKFDQIDKNEAGCEYDAGFIHERLSHPVDKHLCCVKALCLSVTRTVNGSAVAVKKLEVWGLPADGTPRGVLDRLKQCVDGALMHQVSSSPPASPTLSTLNELPANFENEGQPKVGIPAEFLDSITCELMSLPILLPSGMAVDRSTLDKHVSSESKWGRQPSDPFTGRPFNDKHRPVVHSSLKARLDQFFIANGDRMGSSLWSAISSGATGLATSRLVPAATADPDGPLLEEPNMKSADWAGNRANRQDGEKNPVARHSFVIQRGVGGFRRSQDAGSSRKRGRHVEESGDETDGSNTKRSNANCSVDATTGDDLQLKSISSLSVPVSTRMQSAACDGCGMLFNLYRLNCMHHICRKCLVGSRACPVCRTTFNSSEPVRVHY